MSGHDTNDLLNDLRHILHSAPGPESWEALKARLYEAFAHSGELGEVAEAYVREHIEGVWPEKYGPLLDFWIVCVAQEAVGQHKARKKLALDRRIAYKRARNISSGQS